jgi:hypothetical protein
MSRLASWRRRWARMWRDALRRLITPRRSHRGRTAAIFQRHRAAVAVLGRRRGFNIECRRRRLALPLLEFFVGAIARRGRGVNFRRRVGVTNNRRLRPVGGPPRRATGVERRRRCAVHVRRQKALQRRGGGVAAGPRRVPRPVCPRRSGRRRSRARRRRGTAADADVVVPVRRWWRFLTVRRRVGWRRRRRHGHGRVLLDRSGAAGSGSARGEVASWDDRLFATSLLDLSCCEFITGKFIPRRGWQLQRYNDGKLQW